MAESPIWRTDFVSTPEGVLKTVRAASAGRPLLVVHGGPDWDHSYLVAAVEPLLARGIAPILFDLRGCGGSMRCADGSRYKVSAVVQDMALLLDALALPKVDLLGFSFGGIVAQEFVASHPERVARLVLAATAYPVEYAHEALPFAEGAALRRRMRYLFESEPDTLAASRMLASESLELDVHLKASLPVARRLIDGIAFSGEWMRALRAKTLQEDRCFQISTLKTRATQTLFLHGEHDARFPVAGARAMHEALAGSVLEVVADAGHLAYIDAPGRWDEALSGFLTDPARA